MTTRRDLMLGLGFAVVAGAANALQPRRRVSLLGDLKLDTLVPRGLPGWAAMNNVGVVAPPPKGSLADRLYSQTVQRAFQNEAGEIVMLLIAYGDTQSDQLTLHRPESCYPAVGFRVGNGRNGELAVGGRDLPFRRLSASLDDRVEQILYWTRVGEYLPRTAAEQREARFRNALAGIIADGVLVRMSTLTSDPSSGDAVNRAFAEALLAATPVAGRRALLGTAFAGG